MEGTSLHSTAGGVYSKPINVEKGCTQGDVDSPIIFNIIIDAVLRSWKAEETYRGSEALFYVDDGLIENNNNIKVQHDLDILIGLFEKMGLKTNEKKTKYMIFRGPAPSKRLSKEAYERHCTGNGLSYLERRKKRVECSICGKEMQMGSLQRHMLQQHGKKPEQYLYNKKGTEEEFRVDIVKGNNNTCPIPGCSGSSKDKFGMYRHFCLRHPEATIFIPQDGRAERCKLCGMFSMNIEKHQKTKTCSIGRKQREAEKLQNLQADANKVKFLVYGKEIQRVKEFRYLGRILREDDDDTSSIVSQIKRARQKWNAIAKILKREEANAKTMAKFYMAIVQAVLLYGADSWTITKRNWKRLQSFHNRALRYMTGQHIRKKEDRSWTYPDHAALGKQCCLFPIETYVERRRGTLRNYLQKHRKTLMDELEKVKPPSTNANKVLWWKQKWITKDEMTQMTNFWFT